MDERLSSTFDVEEIVCDNDTARLCHREKDVIGEISLSISIKIIKDRIRQTTKLQFWLSRHIIEF
jgi:hypothetical protein